MNELQKLYDVLVREGKYTKSFEEFQNQWNDEAYKDKVYDVVSRDGLYTKDRNSFKQKYSGQVQQDVNEDGSVVEQAFGLANKIAKTPAAPQKTHELPRMPKPGELQNIGREDENAAFDSQGNYNPINALPESIKVTAKQIHAENEAKKKAALQSDLSSKQKAVESTAQQQEDASLLASQSAREAEVLSPLLKNEFLKGVYQQLKDEETLPSFVKDQLNQITPELISLGEFKDKDPLNPININRWVANIGVEEAVVPKMNYMFGPLGFKFEEAGMTGDYMTVTAPNKETIEISLNNTYSKNEEETKKLKNFIASNSTKIPQIEKYAAQYAGSDMRFNSEKQIEAQTKDISIQYDKLNKDAALLSNDIKNVESDLAYLNSAPANERNTPQYLEKKKATETALLDINTRRQEIISRNSQIEANKTNLNRAVGKYTAMKAEQGTWSGATVAWLGEGVSTALTGLLNLTLDLTTVGGMAPRMPYYTEEMYKKDKKETLSVVREGIQGSITDPNTSVEWKQLAEEGFWGGAYAGLVKSAPAMLAPGGWAGRTAAFFGQSNDAVNQEMDKNPAFDNVSSAEKLLVTVPIGIANAVLEEVGLSNMIKNKGFVNSLVLKAMQKAGVNTTETALSKIIKNDVESMIARGAISLTGAGLAEAETGAGQQIAEYAVKDIYNMAKEKEMFDTPDSLKEYVYDVVRSGAQEAVGGFVMGTPSAAAAAFRKRGFEGMSDEQFETFEAIANDEKMQSSFVANLKAKTAAGEMTMAEAKEELNDYRNSVGLYRSIPTDLDTESKKKAMNLVREKQVIEESIKDKDEALVKKQKDRIAEINNQLNTLSENAVQEQTTSEVPIQSEAGVGQEVEGGTPTTEPQVTTEEVKEEEVVTPEVTVAEAPVIANEIDNELKSINESIGRVKQEFNQEEDDITLYELEDKVVKAKRNLSKAEDTDAAINELKKAEKEKSDFEESLAKRKDFNDVDNLISDEIEQSKKDTYEYKDLFEQDPRLAAMQSAKDMIEFAKENPDTEVDVARYENDIKLLEEDITKFPVKTNEAVTTPVTEAPATKDVFKIDGVEYDQDQAIEKTKEAEIKWGSKMEYSGENEQAKAFADDYNKRTNPYNEDGKLKGQYIQARIAEALNKLPFKKFAELYRKHINPTFSSRNYKLRKGTTFQQEAPYIIGNATFDSKEATDQFLAFAKEAGIEVTPVPAVEATPVAKPAPVAEAPAVEAPVAEAKPKAKPTKKAEPAPAPKGKSLLTDELRKQIADIAAKWKKTRERYIKREGEEPDSRIEYEVHGFVETENGLKEDLLDFDSFTGIRNINKDIERIKENYPNLSRIDFRYPTREDGRDWDWISIYEVEAPPTAEAVVEEAPVVEAAPAPKEEPTPTPTPAPAKKTAAEKQLDEEMQQLMLEIDYAQDKIERIKEEIEIEKGNTKEGVAEIKEKMAKVRELVTNKETRRNLLEELEAELEQFKEDQADLIQSYKDDIAQEQADMKKAQKRLDKLTAKKEQAAQPEAAPKKVSEMTVGQIKDKFPLAYKYLNLVMFSGQKISDKSKVTSDIIQDLIARVYNDTKMFKFDQIEFLNTIQEVESLAEQMFSEAKKVSKEEFKKQIAESGDFNKRQLNIFNALVDSLQTETMPEYISSVAERKALGGGNTNFFVNALNKIISKEPNAFIHEIGHFAFYKILSKEDRLNYMQYMINSSYGGVTPFQSMANRLALTADDVVGRTADGGEVTAESNVADNFSEYFAEQFRQWYMSERLFPKDIDAIFGKVAKFFNLFIEKLKSGKYVDKNLSEYFNKISVKIEKQQKKNEKIQEALGIEETMMNELQDLEDFFGIDPEISPMSMRYDTPLQKMALMYNMTESGFFPRNASEPHINRDFFQFGLKAKRATSGSYYLVNIKTGKMVKPLQRPKGGIPPQVSRMSVTPISVKGMSMDDVIETARENGFSDDVIKALLMKRGYAAKDIDSALTFNINFASAYTNNNPRTDSPLPRAFRTVDGGVNAGIKLFFDVRNKLIDFAKSDPKKKKTYAEIRAKAVELLEANPIFQGQEDTKQLELIAAFDKTLNITRGKAISAQIADIRKAIKERLEGVKDLKKAQLILRNFIRQSLPAVKVPRVFFNLEGLTSPAEGINYFNGLRKQVYDFARTGADGKLGKKILKTTDEIRSFAINTIKQTDLYNKQTPEVQQQMVNGFINSEYTKGPSHTLDIYSQREVNKLIDVISQTDAKNFLSQAEKVFDIIVEQRAKIKAGLIKEMMNLVNKKAKAAITSTGKRRAKGLDAQGQSFYQNIKPILKAAITNDTDAMIAFAAELSDTDAIDDALAKEAAGEKLTLKEQALLDKALAFDTFGDIINMELEEVQDLLDGLKGIRSESIVRLNEKRAERAAQREAMAEEAEEQIKKDFKALYNPDGTLKDKNQLDNDKAMIWQSFKELKIWSGLKQWLDRYDFVASPISDFFRKTLAHLGTISNILDKTGTFFNDNVYRPLNRMDEVNKTGYSNEMKYLDELANSIKGITKGYKQIRRLIDSVGEVKMVINGRTDLKSGDQLARIYALSLNEVQRAKLQKMGYTDQKIEEIKKILGPEVVQFADKLVGYFSNEYYESVNDVYSFVNDVNLGYVENYFPTQTLSPNVSGKLLEDGDFSGIFNAESSPAFKERTDVSSDIDLAASFTNVVESHFQAMERYKAYAVGVKRLNDLFKIPSVNTLLEETGLKSIMKNLVNMSVNPNAGVKQKQTTLGRAMNKFSGYALAFKLAQIPKQATAIVAAYEDYQFLKNRKVPGLDAIMFAFDMAKALTFARSNFNKFYNISGNFRDRIVKGVEGDVYGLESGGRVFKPLSQKATTLGDVKRFIKSSAASPTMVGDIISVYGYMANYNRDIANGMSPEAALEKFNNYNATLQSRRAADKGTIQFAQNEYVRAFTMFGSTGILQMNKVAMAYKNIMRSIGNKQVPSGKDLRALAINLGVANAMFVAASYAFALMKGDDEDKEKVEKKMFEALVGLNLIYQIPLIGGAVEEVYNAIKGEKTMGGDVTNPYTSVFRKIKKYYDDDNTIIENFRPAAELALGMQLDPFIGLYEGATEEFDDEVMYDILGISPSYRPQNNSSLEKMNKTELKRYNPEEYERLYGPGSKDYDEEQAKKEAKAAERKARKDAMDDYYNYESKDDNKRGGSRIKSRGGSRASGSRIK